MFAGTAAQIKAENYIKDAEDEDAWRFLPYAMRIPALRPTALERLKDASVETLGRVIKKDVSPEHWDEQKTCHRR
jgi:hypothetical protein